MEGASNTGHKAPDIANKLLYKGTSVASAVDAALSLDRTDQRKKPSTHHTVFGRRILYKTQDCNKDDPRVPTLKCSGWPRPHQHASRHARIKGLYNMCGRNI